MGKLLPNHLDRMPDLSDSACRELDTELWYLPDHAGQYDRHLLQTLRAVCAGCPVKVACLKYSLRNERFGVWGGLTAAERAALLEATNNKASTGYAVIMGKADAIEADKALRMVGITVDEVLN